MLGQDSEYKQRKYVTGDAAARITGSSRCIEAGTHQCFPFVSSRMNLTRSILVVLFGVDSLLPKGFRVRLSCQLKSPSSYQKILLLYISLTPHRHSFLEIPFSDIHSLTSYNPLASCQPIVSIASTMHLVGPLLVLALVIPLAVAGPRRMQSPSHPLRHAKKDVLPMIQLANIQHKWQILQTYRR